MAVLCVPKDLFSGMADRNVRDQIDTHPPSLFAEALELFSEVRLSVIKHRVDLDRDRRLGQTNDTNHKQSGFELLSDFQT